MHAKQDPRGENCALQRGAAPASGAASRAVRAAYQRATGHRLALKADYHSLCIAIMERHHAGYDLKQDEYSRFTLPRHIYTKAQAVRKQHAYAQHGYGRRLRQTADIPVQFTPAAGRPQVYSVMDLCTSPCFGSDSGQSRCCPVPMDVAQRFSCCRSSNCCPDNAPPNGHKRRLRARTRRGPSSTTTILG